MNSNEKFACKGKNIIQKVNPHSTHELTKDDKQGSLKAIRSVFIKTGFAMFGWLHVSDYRNFWNIERW